MALTMGVGMFLLSVNANFPTVPCRSAGPAPAGRSRTQRICRMPSSVMSCGPRRNDASSRAPEFLAGLAVQRGDSRRSVAHAKTGHVALKVGDQIASPEFLPVAISQRCSLLTIEREDRISSDHGVARAPRRRRLRRAHQRPASRSACLSRHRDRTACLELRSGREQTLFHSPRQRQRGILAAVEQFAPDFVQTFWRPCCQQPGFRDDAIQILAPVARPVGAPRWLPGKGGNNPTHG